MDGEEID